MLKLLFLGDIVGRPGRRIIKDQLPRLKAELGTALVVANGENAAGGLGIEPATANEIFAAGVDVITTGNHVWSKRDVYGYLNQYAHKIIRPLNYPAGVPGKGFVRYRLGNDVTICIVNMQGRVFLNDLVDCPFKSMDVLLENELKGEPNVFVDFHAEATSEKCALGWYLDGRVTAVFGTHTHVQTADERVLTKGTAFIADAGMCGPRDGVLGVDTKLVINRFTKSMPMRMEVARGATMLNGVVVEFDETTGRALGIERIRNWAE